MTDDDVRVIPTSELDFAYLTTDPAWGKEASSELKEKLMQLVSEAKENKDGGVDISTVKRSMWGLLTYYTRDIRLGNLGRGETLYCQFYLDLAGDCLKDGYIKSFLTALTRAVTQIEISQSKGGFFRKRTNTLTTEFGNADTQSDKVDNIMGGGKR